MGCICQPFWILQEKVGIFFYFWIIWVVNSQLALLSHVRYNTPQHLQTPQNIPQMRIKDFNCDNSYLPSLTCHMDVRVHIGRSSGRSTPPPSQSSIDALNTITLHGSLPGQLSTDAFHTTTPTARSNLGQCIYIECRWTPQSFEHRMPCILLHPLLDLVLIMAFFYS